uniref:Uncharacterized protein n=1 Tax=Dunaliella tertiolecta TaxID=3047 RepID=A0A7S3QNI2_DUNTE
MRDALCYRRQEPGVPPAVSSHTAATAAQHPADDAHVGSAQDPVQGNGSSSAAVGEASHAAGGASSVGGSGAGPGSKSKRRGGLPEADAHELAQLKTAMVRLEKSMKEACKKPEEDKVKLEKQEASTLKKIKSICEGRLKKLGQK